MLANSGDLGRSLIGESGLSLSLPQEDIDHPSKPPPVLDSGKLALELLVNRTVPQHEFPLVIETIVSNVKAADIVECLQGSDAQTFVDVIDEACHHFIPLLRI